MTKKKIALLISGEIRTNSLGGGKNTTFEETFKQNFLNDEVTNSYEINIFFVTDKIIEEKAYAYFGEYLKGLLQLSFQDIDEPLNLDELINNYMTYYNYRLNNPNKFNSEPTPPRITQVYKFYKLYAAYKLMRNYEIKYAFKYDYIGHLRPDTVQKSNFYSDIKQLEDFNREILIAWDHGYFGQYDIMCHICKLVLCYGKYNYGEIEHDVLFTRQIINSSVYFYIKKNIWNCWSESPEVQLFEHILDYCYLNNIKYDKIWPVFNTIEVFPDRKDTV